MRATWAIMALLLITASGMPLAAHAQTAPSAAASAEVNADTIVVTGQRSAKTAREEQRAAVNIVTLQSAEDIVKYPDFNAAESLGRLPGVTVSTETGEGCYVVIRGIDSNLNGTTFGGVTLLSTQAGNLFGGGGRAVHLDTIPNGAIDQVSVRKTGIPDQEAEGLGGSVDIVPRTASGLKQAFVDGTVGGGYQALHGHAGVYRGELAAGTRFGGPDKPFGIVLTGSYFENALGSEDAEPAPLDATPPSPTNRVLDSFGVRRYNFNRRRFAFGGELSYDPTPRSHYYIRADDTGYTERNNTQFLTYRNLGNTLPGGNGEVLSPDSGGNFVAANATAQLSLRDVQETQMNFIGAVGGHNDFGGVLLDYQGSYTASTYHRDYDYFSTFDTSVQSFTATYNNDRGVDGLPSLTLTGFNPRDLTQFTLTGFRNTAEGAHDREWAGRADVTIPLRLIGKEETTKFGGKVRFRDKRDTQHRFTYFPNSKDPSTRNLTLFPVASLAQLQGAGPYNNLYGGQYAIGYVPDYLAIRALIPNNKTRTPPRLSDQPRFNDTENIVAGYVEYRGKVGKLGYLAGVRVENTDGTYRSFDIGGSGAFLVGKSNYTDFFLRSNSATISIQSCSYAPPTPPESVGPASTSCRTDISPIPTSRRSRSAIPA